MYTFWTKNKWLEDFWIQGYWLGVEEDEESRRGGYWKDNTWTDEFWISRFWLEIEGSFNVKGYFRYVDTEGILIECNNVIQIPSQIIDLVTFEPNYPEPPHTDKDHSYLENLQVVFQEIFNRRI